MITASGEPIEHDGSSPSCDVVFYFGQPSELECRRAGLTMRSAFQSTHSVPHSTVHQLSRASMSGCLAGELAEAEVCDIFNDSVRPRRDVAMMVGVRQADGRGLG